MNNIKIYTIGKVKNKNILKEIDELLRRVPRVKLIELKEVKNNSTKIIKQKEEGLILKSIKTNIKTYLLTELGKTYTTYDFSKKILNSQNETQFIICGPYGPSETLKKTIKNHLSLSEMTFTQEQALYMLIEQLYRTQCIEKNIPYTK